MPTISQKLSIGDWAGAYRVLRQLGDELLEPDPEAFAWQAFRGLAGNVRWRHDVISPES
jgi:hypothetical protein